MKKYISYLLKSCLAVLALVLVQLGAGTFAFAQQTGSDFDHSATGFVLTAPHQNVPQEYWMDVINQYAPIMNAQNKQEAMMLKQQLDVAKLTQKSWLE